MWCDLEVRPGFDIAYDLRWATACSRRKTPDFPGDQYLIAGSRGVPTMTRPTKNRGAVRAAVDHRAGLRQRLNRERYPFFDYQTLGDELDTANRSWRYYTTPGTKYGTELLPDPDDAVEHFVLDRPGGDTAVGRRNVATSKREARRRLVGELAGAGFGPIRNSTTETVLRDRLCLNAVGKRDLPKHGGLLRGTNGAAGTITSCRMSTAFWPGLSVRLLVVSAWSKRGYISSVGHEFGSILKFTEETFNLPSLGQRDEYADDLSDCFDFYSPPRTNRSS